MTTLMQYLTAFGLAASAGTRASVPVLALGLFHYTPYFELSREWSWIASPIVMAVLFALLALEFYAEAHPELSALNRLVGYAPALLSGFIAFASVTGTLDKSLLHLAASGILGGTTAVAVRYARNKVHRVLEPFHEPAGRFISVGETGASMVVSSAAMTVPFAGIVVASVFGLIALLVARKWSGPWICQACGTENASEAVLCGNGGHPR